MQKIFFSIFIVAILAACSQPAKKQFEISGTIKNAGNKMVYLQETPLGSGQQFVVDSFTIGGDGSYHVKGKASEENLYSLFIKNETYPFAFVINDAAKITVNADAADQNNYTVSGSPETESLKKFFDAANEKYAEIYFLGQERDSLQKAGAPDSVMSEIDDRGNSRWNEFHNYVTNFIQNSPSPVSCFLALNNYNQIFTPNDYQSLLNNIVKRFPKHKGVAAIKEMTERQMALAKQKSQEMEQANWIGKQAPELALPDINGKEIKLSSFKGKYVLVDFWASWCLPCRKENPNVVQAYNKYKDKNFTILGVSLDKEKGDWINAIQKDNLSWTQVSDLQEWNSVAVSTFNFDGIPFNVLIDPNGKIIAESLRGEELNKKLDEVLK
jgi:peroxiredoxin